MTTFSDEAMVLVDEVVNAARKDDMLMQSVLEPRAREALRQYLERGPSEVQQDAQRIAAWKAGFKQGAWASVPEGWQLVPQEPTRAMVNAPFVGKVEDQSIQGQAHRRTTMADNYRAMLAAAPNPLASSVFAEHDRTAKTLDSTTAEPVAWLYENFWADGAPADWKVLFEGPDEEPWGKRGVDFSDELETVVTPLYEAPPARRPLTEAEIGLAIYGAEILPGEEEVRIVRAAEAALWARDRKPRATDKESND